MAAKRDQDDGRPTAREWPAIIDAVDDVPLDPAAESLERCTGTVRALRAKHRALIERLRTDPGALADAINTLARLITSRALLKASQDALNNPDTDTPPHARLASLAKSAADLARVTTLDVQTEAKRPKRDPAAPPAPRAKLAGRLAGGQDRAEDTPIGCGLPSDPPA